MCDYIEATKDEQKVINSLKRVAKKWPDSLWLFSASGTLCVMQKGKEGRKMSVGDGVDQEYVVDYIDIENDGGDW